MTSTTETTPVAENPQADISTLSITHKFTRVNQNDYDEAVRRENQLTRRLSQLDARIQEKRELIFKGYKLVETGETTKKRQAAKRTREHYRSVQLDRLRVELHQREEERVTVLFDLKVARRRLAEMNRAMKYFARFDMAVTLETRRSQVNEDSLVNRAVKVVRKSAEFTRGGEPTSEGSILMLLIHRAPALFEVFRRKDALRQKFVTRASAELAPAAK